MIGVLMPVVARLWFPKRLGLMMGVYTMSLCIGAASATGLSEPLALAFRGSWAVALAIWVLPALVAALLWTVWGGRSPCAVNDSSRSASGAIPSPGRSRPSWRPCRRLPS